MESIWRVLAEVSLGKLAVTLSSQINPGVSTYSQVTVNLRNKSKITQNNIVQGGICTGVFLERADGTCSEVAGSTSAKTSQAFLIEHC